ncbi:GNAT family N-acetyltransferase [Vibrio sp. 10N.286.49.B3]|uniref:GNAT family N-acetyltransferase n=1 Tax=Vibrio sp. 10N.286.49.B3 TaxID=1880855 RepID=UPI000C82CA60|nr:GNAT family N-acetyltransferase [Vibrio sp. 10N.286.49.B3]PMH46632.1 GNAT family N-acetyltransferase [Vibrio sp. 10N.286.49.B3]
MTLTFSLGTIDDLLLVDAQVPEFDGRTTRQKIEARLVNKPSLILIAKSGDTPVAYKVGYQLSDSEFYSWLGGVIPSYRKQGIATILREKQEAWALSAGYSKLSVKSMNRYPAMLQLLISSQYQISGYEDNGSTSDSKISFIKTLVK